MGAPFEAPDLSGKVAIVTGASRGIGRCVALALASAGADIVVASRSERSRELLPGSIHETAAEIEALGRRALAVRTNVRKADEIEAMVARAADEMGRIDILIHNAGALWWETVGNTPIKRFDLVVDVNARAAFVAARAVLPHMEQAGGGHIVVYSPPIDIAMAGGKVAYCISKFGMTLLAHGMAEEVRHLGVSVNALWPATLIESQATINHGLGTPAQWRKPDILADATLAILARRADELSGQALIDEDVLRAAGTDDLGSYSCVPGSQPQRIIGAAAASPLWRHRAPGDQAPGAS